MSENTPESQAGEESPHGGDEVAGISDDQLPEDLQPGEDNPLAEPLDPGETPEVGLNEPSGSYAAQQDEQDGTESVEGDD